MYGHNALFPQDCYYIATLNHNLLISNRDRLNSLSLTWFSIIQRHIWCPFVPFHANWISQFTLWSFSDTSFYALSLEDTSFLVAIFCVLSEYIGFACEIITLLLTNLLSMSFRFSLHFVPPGIVYVLITDGEWNHFIITCCNRCMQFERYSLCSFYFGSWHGSPNVL